MLGHKGESYSQAIAELGFQLMAMRLTAEQAANVTRVFVQLPRPDKIEGEEQRGQGRMYLKLRNFLYLRCKKIGGEKGI